MRRHPVLALKRRWLERMELSVQHLPVTRHTVRGIHVADLGKRRFKFHYSLFESLEILFPSRLSILWLHVDAVDSIAKTIPAGRMATITLDLCQRRAAR
jgi:hypothetical protein